MIHRAGDCPPGVLAVAAAMLGDASPLLWSVDHAHADRATWLERELLAPLTLDHATRPPTQPTVTGDGWVQAEIVEEDSELFEAMLQQHGGDGAEVLAAKCQELRLPISPYRRLPPQQPQQNRTRSHRDLETVTKPTKRLVIDMTSHWAGPLATMLLADAGATVVKIDPDCRPDGFRAQPRLYDHLNGAKEILDLDLRIPADRARFEVLAGKADLLVESFSRRVMPNLGYSAARLRRINPSLRVLSVKAFPRSTPNGDWLAFGPGVHAMSGLAFLGSEGSTTVAGQPATAAVAYPDFLTGLAGFIEGLRLLSTPAHGHGEVTLAGSIQPLVHQAIAGGRVEPSNV